MKKCHNDDKIPTRTIGAGVGDADADEVGVGVAEEVEVGVLVNVLVTLKESGTTVVR